jgi:hypothetical protein
MLSVQKEMSAREKTSFRGSSTDAIPRPAQVVDGQIRVIIEDAELLRSWCSIRAATISRADCGDPSTVLRDTCPRWHATGQGVGGGLKLTQMLDTWVVLTSKPLPQELEGRAFVSEQELQRQAKHRLAVIRHAQ